MRLGKFVVPVSSLLVYLLLAAQSTKANSIGDTIIFHDLTDTLNVDGSSRFALGTQCGAAPEVCTVALNAPAALSTLSGNFTFYSSTLPASYLIGEGNNTISDELDPLVFVPNTSMVTFKFISDVVEGAGGPCPLPSPATPLGCVTETGQQQTAGTITWMDSKGNTITDTVAFASNPEPEPASLILFGSGLAIAGGFLRRRRRRDALRLV